MLFSYNWLNDYLQYKISPQEIGELLTMHAFEVESVSKKGDDWILNIDVLPNRAPDALSHQGIAHEVNAIGGFLKKYEKKQIKEFAHFPQVKEFFERLAKSPIAIEREQDSGEVYQLMSLEGVNVGPSPAWLKERLESLGIASINNLVDSTNYVMLDTGQPMHIFDADAIDCENNVKKIFVRRAKNGERLRVLGGASYTCTSKDLVIADIKNVLAIAGIKGGERSGVSSTTKNILIEAAHFNRMSVYASAKRLNLHTESAKRFGAGIPPQFTFLGLYKATSLVQEVAGGVIKGYLYDGAKELPRTMPALFITQEKINDLSGIVLPEKTTKDALYHLGFDVQKEREDAFKVLPPYWRLDCQIPEDIIEEIVRLYGLDKIPAVAPHVSLLESLRDGDTLALRSFVRRYFSAQGFDELYNYSFRNSQQPASKESELPRGQAANSKELIKLLNPISEEKAYLRNNVIDGLLKNIAENQGLFHEMKFFEIGRVFWREGSVVKEKEHLAGVLFGKKDADFREARGFVEGLLEALGFDADDYLFEDKSAIHSHPFLSLSVNGKLCGFVEIPELPHHLKIKGKVVAFEIDTQALFTQVEDEREFQAPPKFPAVVRDISLLLQKQISGDSAIQIIHEVGKELIEDVDLFDIYEEPDGEGRNLAFHIIYRSKEKTLTDEDVNALHNKIEKELTKRLHVQIR